MFDRSRTTRPHPKTIPQPVREAVVVADVAVMEGHRERLARSGKD